VVHHDHMDHADTRHRRSAACRLPIDATRLLIDATWLPIEATWPPIEVADAITWRSA
jgi:hypothetical protein